MSSPALRPYQEHSVRRMADMILRGPKHGGVAGGMLGHDPGLGKTPICVRTCDAVRAERILVVSTVSSLYNWQREFMRWQTIPRAVHVVDDSAGGLSLVSGPCVYVMGYSQFSNLTGAARALNAMGRFAEWDVVICDEAHYLKSLASNRTKRLHYLMKTTAEAVLLVSGTMAPNHHGEFYAPLTLLAPELLQSRKLYTQDDFTAAFCQTRATPYGLQPVASRDTPGLQRLLHPLLHRFRERDVLKDLPELQFDVYPLALPQGVLSQIKTILPGGATLDPAATPEAVLAEAQLALPTQRRALGLLKVPGVTTLILDELSGDAQQKLIVFAYHREVLAQLDTGLREFEPVVCSGGQQARQRQENVDRFQTDPNCRVFLGQVDAAGEAITLTASNRVLFAEQSWGWKEMYQAAKRAHRFGQTRPVLARVLSVPGTLDDALARVVARKAQMTADLFG